MAQENNNLSVRLPNGVYYLEYSFSQDCFHFEDEHLKTPNGWVRLGCASTSELSRFVDAMDRKYVKGRVNGRYPEVAIIKLEFELFNRLKSSKLKLVNR